MHTALSLVQDARPTVGETVAVFGQGMIGLLVTAILSASFGSEKIIAVEPNCDRAAVSRRIGAGRVIDPRLPQALASAEAPDVSIEVSGSASALQAALDHTGRGGRIVLGALFSCGRSGLR